MQYIKSNLIEVFPAGFRGSDYSQSKYTTEHNLTYMALISSANNMQNSLIQDPYDSDNVILNLHGYFFRFKEDDLPKGTDLYAAIALRKLETFESVLAPIYPETVSNDNFVLDVEGDFKGLAFGTVYEFKNNADALLQVRDTSGELIKTNAAVITTTDNVFNSDKTPISSELLTKKLNINNGLVIDKDYANFNNINIKNLSLIANQTGNKLGISGALANCAVCIANEGEYLNAKDLSRSLSFENGKADRQYLVNGLTISQDASGGVTTEGKKLYIGNGLKVYQSSSTPIEYSLGVVPSTNIVSSIGGQSGDIILDAETLTIEVDDTSKTKKLKVINGGGGGTAGVSSFEKETGAITIDKKNLKMNGKQLGTKDDITVTSITATSFNATSDARKKENIVDYRCENSILDLPIKKFDFINGKKNNIGCLAQDLQKICPEIVHEDSEGYLNIEESKLIYLLLQEVKELKAEIANLKRYN